MEGVGEGGYCEGCGREEGRERVVLGVRGKKGEGRRERDIK